MHRGSFHADTAVPLQRVQRAFSRAAGADPSFQEIYAAGDRDRLLGLYGRGPAAFEP